VRWIPYTHKVNTASLSGVLQDTDEGTWVLISPLFAAGIINVTKPTLALLFCL
jgi:hypothetical protein